jgi:hypothetical protein
MSRISAKRFSSRLVSNILIDCLSRPAAPRLRFTALKALYSVSRVILPVSECTRSVRGSTVSIQVILREQIHRGCGVRLTLNLFLGASAAAPPHISKELRKWRVCPKYLL